MLLEPVRVVSSGRLSHSHLIDIERLSPRLAHRERKARRGDSYGLVRCSLLDFHQELVVYKVHPDHPRSHHRLGYR